MKKNLISFFFLTFLIPSPLFAETVVEVPVKTTQNIKTVSGIVVSSSGVLEVTKINHKRLNENTVIVQVPVDISNLPQDSMVSALAVTENDEYLPAVMVSPFRAMEEAPWWKLPECKEVMNVKPSSQIPLSEQLSLIESIVNVRKNRLNAALERIDTHLEGDTLIRLAQLEEAFGYQYPNPLSSDLPAEELVTRLTQLRDAIKSFNKSKNPR